MQSLWFLYAQVKKKGGSSGARAAMRVGKLDVGALGGDEEGAPPARAAARKDDTGACACIPAFACSLPAFFLFFFSHRSSS